MLSDTIVECLCADTEQITKFEVHSSMLAVSSRVLSTAFALSRLSNPATLVWQTRIPQPATRFSYQGFCTTFAQDVELLNETMEVTFVLSFKDKKFGMTLQGLSLEVVQSLLNVFYNEDWQMKSKYLPCFLALMVKLKVGCLDDIIEIVDGAIAKKQVAGGLPSVVCEGVALSPEKNSGLSFLAYLFQKCSSDDDVSAAMQLFELSVLVHLRIERHLYTPPNFDYISCRDFAQALKTPYLRNWLVSCKVDSNSSSTRLCHIKRSVCRLPIRRKGLKIITYIKGRLKLKFTLDRQLFSVTISLNTQVRSALKLLMGPHPASSDRKKLCIARTSAAVLHNSSIMLSAIGVQEDLSVPSVLQVWHDASERKRLRKYKHKWNVDNFISCKDEPMSIEKDEDCCSSVAGGAADEFEGRDVKGLMKTEVVEDDKEIVRNSLLAALPNTSQEFEHYPFDPTNYCAIKQEENAASFGLPAESGRDFSVSSPQSSLDIGVPPSTSRRKNFNFEEAFRLKPEEIRHYQSAMFGRKGPQVGEDRMTMQDFRNFASLKELEDSVDGKKNKLEIKPCPRCAMTFGSAPEAIVHIQQHHLFGVTKSQGSECVDPSCPVSVRVFNEVDHLLKHLVQSPLPCSLCSFSCRTRGGMTRHNNMHELAKQGRLTKHALLSAPRAAGAPKTSLSREKKKRVALHCDPQLRKKLLQTPKDVDYTSLISKEQAASLGCEDVHELAYHSIVRPKVYIPRKPKPRGAPPRNLGIRLPSYSACEFHENTDAEMASFRPPPECLVCGKPFSAADTPASTALHYYHQHKHLMPMHCPFPRCPLVLRQSPLMLEHVRHHLWRPRYSCTLCSFSAETTKTIKLHFRAHVHVQKPLTKKSKSKKYEESPPKEARTDTETQFSSVNEEEKRSQVSQSILALAPRKFVKNPPISPPMTPLPPTDGKAQREAPATEKKGNEGPPTSEIRASLDKKINAFWDSLAAKNKSKKEPEKDEAVEKKDEKCSPLKREAKPFQAKGPTTQRGTSSEVQKAAKPQTSSASCKKVPLNGQKRKYSEEAPNAMSPSVADILSKLPGSISVVPAPSKKLKAPEKCYESSSAGRYATNLGPSPRKCPAKASEKEKSSSFASKHVQNRPSKDAAPQRKKCPQCSVAKYSVKDISRHYVDCHIIRGEFVCPFCLHGAAPKNSTRLGRNNFKQDCFRHLEQHFLNNSQMEAPERLKSLQQHNFPASCSRKSSGRRAFDCEPDQKCVGKRGDLEKTEVKFDSFEASSEASSEEKDEEFLPCVEDFEMELEDQSPVKSKKKKTSRLPPKGIAPKKPSHLKRPIAEVSFTSETFNPSLKSQRLDDSFQKRFKENNFRSNSKPEGTSGSQLLGGSSISDVVLSSLKSPISALPSLKSLATSRTGGGACLKVSFDDGNLTYDLFKTSLSPLTESGASYDKNSKIHDQTEAPDPSAGGWAFDTNQNLVSGCQGSMLNTATSAHCTPSSNQTSSNGKTCKGLLNLTSPNLFGSLLPIEAMGSNTGHLEGVSKLLEQSAALGHDQQKMMTYLMSYFIANNSAK